MLSQGSGSQNFFLGSSGSETVTGSTATGASNNYFLIQSPSLGGGADAITNFNISRDSIFILPPNPSSGGVVVQQVQIIGTDSYIYLSNNSEIRLVGVELTSTQQARFIGNTSL